MQKVTLQPSCEPLSYTGRGSKVSAIRFAVSAQSAFSFLFPENIDKVQLLPDLVHYCFPKTVLPHPCPWAGPLLVWIFGTVLRNLVPDATSWCHCVLCHGGLQDSALSHQHQTATASGTVTFRLALTSPILVLLCPPVGLVWPHGTFVSVQSIPCLRSLLTLMVEVEWGWSRKIVSWKIYHGYEFQGGIFHLEDLPNLFWSC